MTQENMAITYEALAENQPAQNKGHLEEALACVDRALEVYDPDNMPYNFGTATGLRAQIFGEVGWAGVRILLLPPSSPFVIPATAGIYFSNRESLNAHAAKSPKPTNTKQADEWIPRCGGNDKGEGS